MELKLQIPISYQRLDNVLIVPFMELKPLIMSLTCLRSSS